MNTITCDKCHCKIDPDYRDSLNEIYVNDTDESIWQICQWCKYILIDYLSTKPTKKEKQIIDEEKERLAAIEESQMYND